MNSLFEKFAKNHNICPLVVMNITSMQRVYCIWWHKLIRGLILNFLNISSITDTQQRRLKLQAFSEMKNEADRSLLWSNCAERIEHPHCVDILLSKVDVIVLWYTECFQAKRVSLSSELQRSYVSLVWKSVLEVPRGYISSVLTERLTWSSFSY